MFLFGISIEPRFCRKLDSQNLTYVPIDIPNVKCSSYIVLSHHYAYSHYYPPRKQSSKKETSTPSTSARKKLPNEHNTCINVLKISIKDYNRAFFVRNVMHFKRAMMKQYPKKGVIEKTRVEYS